MVETLKKWAIGKSVGFTMVTVVACQSIEKATELLEMRRSFKGRFAIEPFVDELTWLSFYSSPRSWLLQCFVDFFPGIDAELVQTMETFSNPTDFIEEQQTNIMEGVIAMLSSVNSDNIEELSDNLQRVLEFKPAVMDNVELPPAIYFILFTALPCWLVYGATPHQLLVQAGKNGPSAAKAIERLVKLDPRIIQHPIVQRWVRDSKQGSRGQREQSLGKWKTATPYRKIKASGMLVRVSAVLMELASLLGDDLTVPKLREILEQSPISDEARDYLLARTDDDFGREIRRKRVEILWPTKSDKKILKAVRALREQLA